MTTTTKTTTTNPKWLSKEQKMGQIMKKDSRLTDIKATPNMCRWDFESPKYIIEAKYRYKHFAGTTIIEKDKFNALIKEGKKSDRTALFAVQSGKHIYIFNLTKLLEHDYKFEWGTMWCNRTTKIKDAPEAKVPKMVGHLLWEKAVAKFPVK